LLSASKPHPSLACATVRESWRFSDDVIIVTLTVDAMPAAIPGGLS